MHLIAEQTRDDFDYDFHKYCSHKNRQFADDRNHQRVKKCQSNVTVYDILDTRDYTDDPVRSK
jgi:hypothetical protein